jgi:hypothetical protein
MRSTHRGRAAWSRDALVHDRNAPGQELRLDPETRSEVFYAPLLKAAARVYAPGSRIRLHTGGRSSRCVGPGSGVLERQRRCETTSPRRIVADAQRAQPDLWLARRRCPRPGPPGWSPPVPPTPFGGENSAIRCGSSYGSSGSSSSPSGSRPRVSSTSGGSPRNVPIGTPPFSSSGGSDGRRERLDTGHPQAAPVVTRDWIPATPNGVERDLGAAVNAVLSGATRGMTGRQSSGRVARRANEQDRPGGTRAWRRRRSGSTAMDTWTTHTVRERKTTARTSSATKRREAGPRGGQ